MVRKQRTHSSRRYRRKKRQSDGFLNRYDFAYAGRDTVNTAMKGLESLAPKRIKQTSAEVDRLAQRRIQQKIDQRGYKVEKIGPKMIRGAIEDVYKTPFRLLGNLGKKNLHSLNENLTRELILLKDMSSYLALYHGCDTVHEDSTRVLIDWKSGEECIFPTDYPFWERPEDVDSNKTNILKIT